MDGISVIGLDVVLAYELAESLNIEPQEAVSLALKVSLWLSKCKGAVVLTNSEREVLLRGENPWA